MDWKKNGEKLQKAASEHKLKMETDPEYRKKAEKTEKLLREKLLVNWKEKQ